MASDGTPPAVICRKITRETGTPPGSDPYRMVERNRRFEPEIDGPNRKTGDRRPFVCHPELAVLIDLCPLSVAVDPHQQPEQECAGCHCAVALPPNRVQSRLVDRSVLTRRRSPTPVPTPGPLAESLASLRHNPPVSVRTGGTGRGWGVEAARIAVGA